MKPTLLALLLLVCTCRAYAQQEVSIPARTTKASRPSPALVGEVNLLALTPLTGDVGISGSLGVHLPKAHLSLLVSGTTPGSLNDLSAATLFNEGDRFDVYWNGEVNLLVRYHFRPGAFSGLYAQAGIGYEGFELSEKNLDNAPKVTLNNGYVPIGVGYSAFLFASKIFARAGVGAVFLFGNGGEKMIGSQTTSYRWGFVTPELRLGVKL